MVTGTKKYKHEWCGKKMDEKSKNAIKFTDFQLYKDYGSNQKSTLQMTAIYDLI